MKKLTRRNFLTGSASMLGFSALASCANKDLNASEENVVRAAAAPTYVLVHGAWHGGWCWREVRDLLRDAGATVYTPTLTGLGERQHLTAMHKVGLQTHIQDVVKLIEFEELENVILVGHSYAGMVITGVADVIGDKLSELIYLDALVPVNGGSLIDLDNAMSDQQVEAIIASIDASPPEMLPVATLAFLGVDSDHPKAEWLLRRLTPHPIKTIADRLSFTQADHEKIKKTYIFCTEQEKSTQDQARLAALVRQPNWNYLEIESGHDAMVTEPEKLTALFAEVQTLNTADA